MHTEFTPLVSLGGGLLIGGAALFFMLANGRIAGISGIVSNLLPPYNTTADNRQGNTDKQATLVALAFIAGLLLAAPLYKATMGDLPIATMVASPWLLSVAGLVVGIGTAIGSGCTSGHGVCGLGRLSLRSLAATITFMLTAATTVYIIRHVIGVSA